MSAEWADCFDQYECHLRGCYGDDVGVQGCAGKAALLNYQRATGPEGEQ